jgi:perosamine synthetase
MIPLSVPNITGNEWKYIKDCLDTNWVSSVGSYVDRFEQSIADYTGSKYAVSTVNGTAALHISLLLSGVKENDFVIVPDITFIASVNSIKYTSADPILMDVDKDTWQMDLVLLKDFLTKKAVVKNGSCIHTDTGRTIRAIMPVHVLGNMCNMDELMKIAKEFHLRVIEDATESLGSTFNGKHSGRFGDFGCFSFNGNKIITTGGGGMIITDDPELAKRAKHITTQAKSDPFEYMHDEIGFNYRLVNVLAAMGLAQMETLEDFLKRKTGITERYNKELSQLTGIKFQKTGEGVNPNNWLYTVIADKQKELISHLTHHEIQVRPFWVPMHQLKMFAGELFVTENNYSDKIYKNSISLPCSTGVKDEELDFVIKKIKEICN